MLSGDGGAFGTLVDREQTMVVRACYRVLGDLPEAEDAAQEAFLTAYRSLASWRGDGPFGAWLARIAVRVALRAVSRRRPTAWLDATDPGSLGLGEDHDGARRRHRATITAASIERADDFDPAPLAMRAERASQVRAALATLDEPYREVVALRFFAELSLDQIAIETGRPVGTVKTHLRRGLLRLRHALQLEGAA
ncbi:MAG: sigma-70 family RNA polymerase sigma factor [Chloroflexi bacterium]|nr:sigma-70 family RNA polymerase sigma factor [Chloroflexota bacterium]